ncbi:hypothetical protein ATANTOWER_020182 [Ataeniobius toweri]|uniref:Uncharacterized protein n=1 Tax=Ataeniobius toweri TaxID=208326 RepID=A0ABU7C3F0_9TELE|nr:hypothetical protein [Ataeniobius toweri]
MKTTLLLLKPRSDHQLDSPLQYPDIGLTREAEECDPPMVWQTVSRECPAETLSLRRRVEQFPDLKEDRINMVMCSLAGRQNSRHSPQPRRLAVANRLLTVEVSSNFVALDSFSSAQFRG